MMAGMKAQNIIGQMLHARDGGLAAPLDRAAVNYVQAQAEAGGKQMEVKGVAVRFGVVGHFYFGALRLEAGSIVEAPGKHPRYRDAMGLYSHDSAAVLARVGANTMDVNYGENEITYAMRLNPRDGLAQNIWARLARGDLNSASIGFMVLEGEWVEDYDNSLDADDEMKGEKIEIFSCTKAELVEISIVGQGAFSGATSQPAARAPATAELPFEAAGWIPDKEVAANPVGLDLSGVVGPGSTADLAADAIGVNHLAEGITADTDDDGIVEADGTDTTDPAEAEQGAPVDVGEGDTGDVSEGGGATTDEAGQEVGGNQARNNGGSTDWVNAQLAEMSKRGIDPLARKEP